MPQASETEWKIDFFFFQKERLMKRYQSLHNIQIIIWMQIKQAI